MDYDNIIKNIVRIFDPRQDIFYKPLHTKVKDIFYVAKGLNLDNAKARKCNIDNLDILVIDAGVTSSTDCVCDIIYLDNDIVFVIFADYILRAKEKALCDIFYMIHDVIKVMVNLTSNRRGVGGKRYGNMIYELVLPLTSTALAIKCMQSIAYGFNQDDIAEFLKVERYNKHITYGKFDDFIKVCFSESAEDLVGKCLLYEYAQKVD